MAIRSRHATFMAVALASSLAATGSASAAQPGTADGWGGWFARTVAEALAAIGGGEREPDFETGGEVLLDRGLSTVSGGLQRVVPELDRFGAAIHFDDRFRPAYDVGLTQPLVRGWGGAFDLEGSLGYDSGGQTSQTVALNYRRSASQAAPMVAPTRVSVELERDDHWATNHTRHALAGRVDFAGLELGGGFRADVPSAGPSAGHGRPAHGAHARLTASVPRLRWVQLETRSTWSTSEAKPTRLEVSDATYLVRAQPFGPLELTAGRRNVRNSPSDWFTQLQLKVKLGGGA